MTTQYVHSRPAHVKLGWIRRTNHMPCADLSVNSRSSWLYNKPSLLVLFLAV